MCKHYHKVNIITVLAFLITTFLSASALFLTNRVSATVPSVTDEINLTVPVSCSLSGTGMDTHITELHNTESDSAIGESTITAYCNDLNGFSIYAVGFTNNEYGNNNLVSVTASTTNTIPTGINTSGDTSSWAMKLTPITNPTPTYPITIIGSTDDTDKTPTTLDYTSFQSIPNEYALVARRKASTDVGTNAEGSSFKTTYQAYAASGQAAGTYEGQVKYTMVHPYNAEAPKKIVTKNLEIVFDGSPLYFDEEGTQSQNIMRYSMTCESQFMQPYGIYKSSNLDNDGNKNGPYRAESSVYNYGYTGASKMQVTVRYGLMANTGGVALRGQDDETSHIISSFAEDEYSEGQNIYGVESFIIDGASVGIEIVLYDSDDYIEGYDYGIYVTIQPLDENGSPLFYEKLSNCDTVLTEGSYKEPLTSARGFYNGVWDYNSFQFSFVPDLLQHIADHYSSDRVVVEAEIMR